MQSKKVRGDRLSKSGNIVLRVTANIFKSQIEMACLPFKGMSEQAFNKISHFTYSSANS